MPEGLRPAVPLGAFAGPRVAEPVALRISDVDFMRGIIAPAIQYPGVQLKTEESKEPCPDSPGFRFHDLRHYFASLLISKGLDVKVVQKSLRHASAKTTLDVYGHMWPDKEKSARAAVAEVLAARADSLRTKPGLAL